jgi:hypothetical protein
MFSYHNIAKACVSSDREELIHTDSPELHFHAPHFITEDENTVVYTVELAAMGHHKHNHLKLTEFNDPEF